MTTLNYVTNRGAFGNVRQAKLNGRQYLVAPVTMIVPGVLAGNRGPLLYPKEEIAKNIDAWNNVPLTLGHPTNEFGLGVSARSPKVIEKFSLGTVYNTRLNKGKLVAEAWFDTSRIEQLAPEVLSRLNSNQPIELSTGLFTDNYRSEGKFNGRPYNAIAKNYRPDHLAILIDAKGACSLEDGCGVLMNEGKDAPLYHQLTENVIRKTKAGWFVLSEEGKKLGGPYQSRKQATKRLKQVEYFKHNESTLSAAGVGGKKIVCGDDCDCEECKGKRKKKQRTSTYNTCPVANGCGAGSGNSGKGGHGFAKGNTCAKGGKGGTSKSSKKTKSTRKGFGKGKDVNKQMKALMDERNRLEQQGKEYKANATKVEDDMEAAYDKWLKEGNDKDAWWDSKEYADWKHKYNEAWKDYWRTQDGIEDLDKEALKLPIEHIPTLEEYQGYTKKEGPFGGLKYEEAVEKLGDDEISRLMSEHRKRKDEWERKILYEMSMGNISQEQAKSKGMYFTGGEKYGEMPKEMWHVTVASDQVKKSGTLKTRDELNINDGPGLGGGASDTISYTDDEDIAEAIYGSMKEAQGVASGKVTVEDMIDAARTGKGTQGKPYLKRVMNFWDRDWRDGDDIPDGVKQIIEGKKRRWSTLKMSYTDVSDMTADEQRDYRFEFFKRFSYARQEEGGPMDPLFFSTDTKKLADTSPKNISILKIRSKEGAQGYQVNALGEWRSHTGDNVEIVDDYTSEFEERLVANRLIANSCGAGSGDKGKGGHGFAKGNTCAKGGKGKTPKKKTKADPKVKEVREEWSLDKDLYDDLNLTKEEAEALEDVAFTGDGSTQLAGIEVDIDEIEHPKGHGKVLRRIAQRQEDLGYGLNGEPLKPGEITRDGGNFEPMEEPDITEFMRNQYPEGHSWETSGFMLEDGTLLDMSYGSGMRADDHRSIIPSEAAAKRWGWKADYRGDHSRWQRLKQTLHRARAIRLDGAGDGAMIHIENNLTFSQERAIKDFIDEKAPSSVSVDVGTGSGSFEVSEVLDWPSSRDVLDALNRRGRWAKKTNNLSEDELQEREKMAINSCAVADNVLEEYLVANKCPVANGCGAGSPGGKGFSPGNTCAAGKRAGVSAGSPGTRRSTGKDLDSSRKMFEKMKTKKKKRKKKRERAKSTQEKFGGDSGSPGTRRSFDKDLDSSLGKFEKALGKTVKDTVSDISQFEKERERRKRKKRRSYR